jgi:hypothetical protein
MWEGEIIQTNSKNEFIIECEPDSQILVLVAKTAVEETAKLYGPIFTRMVSEYALKFEADKLKESPPENVQGLEAVTNYIIANLGKYPRGYNSLIYGVCKADSKLQGSTGAGAKRAAYIAMKSIMESSGLLNTLIGTTEDAFEAIRKAEELNKEIKSTVSGRYIRGENNRIIMIVPNCLFKDACNAFVKERISRMVGGSECIFLITTNAEGEIVTKKHLDYRLEEFGEPNCKGIIFEF